MFQYRITRLERLDQTLNVNVNIAPTNVVTQTYFTSQNHGQNAEGEWLTSEV